PLRKISEDQRLTSVVSFSSAALRCQSQHHIVRQRNHTGSGGVSGKTSEDDFNHVRHKRLPRYPNRRQAQSLGYRRVVEADQRNAEMVNATKLEDGLRQPIVTRKNS